MRFILILLFYIAAAVGDTVYFKDGRTTYGQTLLISSKYITLEVFNPKTGELTDVSYPRNAIDKIIDESYLTLYRDNTILHKDLKPFYIPYTSNWEYIRTAVNGKRDSLVLKNGAVLKGRIADINSKNVFILQPGNNNHKKEISRRLHLSDVKSINGRAVIFRTSAPRFKKYATYPAILVNTGFAFNNARINTFTEAYVSSITDDPELTSFHIPHYLVGIVVTTDILFTAHWGMGMGWHYSQPGQDNSFQLNWLNVKYFLGSGNRFWVATGVTAASLTLKQSTKNYNYFIDADNIGAGAGIGLDMGNIGDWSVSFAMRYFYFKDQNVAIPFIDATTAEPRLNLSALQFSIALQMGGRL